MKKFVRSLIVASAFAIGTGTLVVVAPGVADAQTKADPKALPPKADPKGSKPVDPKAPVAAKGTVAVKADKAGKFRFYVRDEDGETILMSPKGYSTEEEAMKSLDAAKAILAGVKVTKEKPDTK